MCGTRGKSRFQKLLGSECKMKNANTDGRDKLIAISRAIESCCRYNIDYEHRKLSRK